MTILWIRGVSPYQQGDNGTDVVINEVHFNRTALDSYNYRLYTNGTLSNGTNCFLAFQGFRPHLFAENGTVVSGTSCYAPINGIGQHASLGLAFAIMFAISIFFSLLNLRKHGRRYLAHDRRWNALGRRLRWFWLLFVAACGTISCFMSIDVDRNYLQSSPLTLQSVFYTLLMPGIMAAVWEAVRHWGVWQERQIYDRDAYAFSKASTRKRQEFLLPILFYIFTILNIILTIPRSWSPIEQQHSPEQTAQTARPVATDTRWRTASFTALAGTLIICYSLEHSVYRYKPHPHTATAQFLFYLHAAPSHFLVAIGLLGLKTGYAIASAFEWSLSPLKYDVHPGWLYGLGYAPVLLIIVLFNISGYCELNEDKALIAQRTDLQSARADDIGAAKPPPWWKKQRLRSFARDITGRMATPDQVEMEKYVELGILKPGDKDDPRVVMTRRTNGGSGEEGHGELPTQVVEFGDRPVGLVRESAEGTGEGRRERFALD
ncbi:hypothetical protein BDV25DRAFT_142037 [Aspergillus avenaceus]|uniref:Uncharacterized protein n=1 Tax=Aspergillus avenaceus TaxID=36643 RepID=A0A5N6TPB6_ASPAV|nr:hypothetical protein BDV25DRAFT_142037 [Aspergillus avenaceus]